MDNNVLRRTQAIWFLKRRLRISDKKFIKRLLKRKRLKKKEEQKVNEIGAKYNIL
jgi:hypothetical protein